MGEARIIKALSGFYYVSKNDKIYTCKGRGVFRNQKITPLVGDFVDFDHTEHDEGYITNILPRTNELARPPVANVTQGVIVSSLVEPDFSSLLMDRFLVLFESKRIEPILLLTKQDLADEETLKKIKTFKSYYESIGYKVFLTDNKEDGLQAIQRVLDGEVTVLAGQSGTGKSTFLNHLNPSLAIDTNEISASLGRGKHTTRHVELVSVGNGLIADTPGFSSLHFPVLESKELEACFIEFDDYKGQCRFRGCLHHKEPHCAVKRAVESEEIAPFRYKHYLEFLQEIITRKPRY